MADDPPGRRWRGVQTRSGSCECPCWIFEDPQSIAHRAGPPRQRSDVHDPSLFKRGLCLYRFPAFGTGDSGYRIEDVGETLTLRVGRHERLTFGEVALRDELQAKTPLEKAWVSTVNAHPSLLTALTGWKPTKLSLVDGMDVY
jgi:hypothetical protein